MRVIPMVEFVLCTYKGQTKCLCFHNPQNECESDLQLPAKRRSIILTREQSCVPLPRTNVSIMSREKAK